MRIPRLLLIIIFLGSTISITFQAQAANVKRTLETYTVPDVTLTNHRGETVPFQQLIEQDRPVLVDFIYATCTTICPVLSAGFSNMQRKLRDQSDKVQLVSISIDPEHDTPDIMAKYLARYRSKSNWDFLTGSREDIEKVMHAFDAYVSNKMSHYPLILIRKPNSDQWVRLYGLVGTKALFREVETLYGPLLASGENK